ncbi:MAG: NUDIX hydrolase [Anaerolineae bacterium]|nr:NUDIX hydrolase [Anaerolineae bacterium]
MPRRVHILSQRVVFQQAFFRIQEARLTHELDDGRMSAELVRLNFERGDSVAALVHDVAAGTLLFTEQFRYPAYTKGSGWLLEVPAGTVEAGEAPEATLRREIEEEIGYTLHSVQHISTFFLSPGGTSERIHLYYAGVTAQDKTGPGRRSDSPGGAAAGGGAGRHRRWAYSGCQDHHRRAVAAPAPAGAIGTALTAPGALAAAPATARS